MKAVIHYSFYFLILILTANCARERQDFEPIVRVQLRVLNDLGQPINGARVYAFLNEQDYENAFSTLNFSNSVIQNVLSGDRMLGGTIQSGIAEFILQPNRDHYIFIAFYDNNRFFSMSNYGVTGRLAKIPPRTNLALEAIIKPVNGNVIFYSSASNELPIEVRIGTASNNNVFVGSISGLYTATGTPSPGDNQVLRVQRDPGTYTYYAKSSAGCAWSGFVTLQAGQNQVIDLSKCKQGAVYFYTTLENAARLPLSLTLGGISFQNERNMLTDGFSVSQVIDCQTASSLGANDPKLVCMYRPEGMYTYYVRSADGQCIWTGSVTITDGSCTVVPLSRCNF